MIILMAFLLFCFEILAMLLAKGWENIMILVAAFVAAVIMIMFLIYYNNMITIYKVEYRNNSVVFCSTLKKYYITEYISLEETVKNFVIKTSGKRFILPKYNKFPTKKDRCYTSNEIDEILQKVNK